MLSFMGAQHSRIVSSRHFGSSFELMTEMFVKRPENSPSVMFFESRYSIQLAGSRTSTPTLGMNFTAPWMLPMVLPLTSGSYISFSLMYPSVGGAKNDARAETG